ncbi:hypothetical protein QYM36_007636, partial [Artemia franciscana]
NEFQKKVEEIFKGLEGVKILVDDVLIYVNTPEDHCAEVSIQKTPDTRWTKGRVVDVSSSPISYLVKKENDSVIQHNKVNLSKRVENPYQSNIDKPSDNMDDTTTDNGT